MSNERKGLDDSNKKISISSMKDKEAKEPVKGPLSFISGALTSLLFALLSFWLSKRLIVYFTIHSPDYSSPIAQSIASGLKTLVIGISFLATFSFAFIGLGLILVFLQSLFVGKEPDSV